MLDFAQRQAPGRRYGSGSPLRESCKENGIFWHAMVAVAVQYRFQTMAFRDKRFFLALGFTLSQQVLLALSTYYIAQAGACLATGDTHRVLSRISLFFAFALSAYIASSVATFCTTQASNQIWKQYASSTLSITTENLQYASDKNKKLIAQWLGAEALPTIANACDFYLELFSVCLNIVLTFAVFYVSVGKEIATVIAASLVISFALAMLLRHQIERSAGAMQQRKLGVLLSIEPTWNAAMFGSRKMRETGFRTLDAKMHRYFCELNRYVLLEQVVACGPIILSTLAVIWILQFTALFTPALAGALVAMLPRSLQVFGNVHALSVYLGQFFLVQTRLRNLAELPSKLEKFHQMHSAPMPSIFVWNTKAQEEMNPGDLIKALRAAHLTRGRFLVTGANGSGKSTLLKIIKDMAADAILTTPETRFLNDRSDLSTGQVRLQEIEHVLSMSPPILMLDEWDANLDHGNCQKIDRLLDEASQRMVIIEVRHLPWGVPPRPAY